MKLIHTSDWHLGHQLYNYDRLDEHRHFIRRLAALIAEQRPDALIIAGDIFDQQSPSLAAQQLWVEALGQLLDADPEVEIIAVAGNHDSGSRLAIHAPLLRERLHIVGREPEIIRLGDPHAPTAVVAAVPYLPDFAFNRYLESAKDPVPPRSRAEDSTVPPRSRAEGSDPVEAFYALMAERAREAAGSSDVPRVAVSHLAVSGADTSSHPLRDFNFFPAERVAADFHYHALGHIHFPQSFLDNRVRYSGSPIPLSFDEPYQHSVSLATVESDGEVGLDTIDIEPLRRVVTYPKGKPAADISEISELIEEVRKEHQDGECYLRVRLETIGSVPEAVNVKLRQAFRDTNVRYCVTQPVMPELSKEERANARTQETVTVDEMREIDPLKLADLHFQRKYSRPMTDELRALLTEILQQP